MVICAGHIRSSLDQGESKIFRPGLKQHSATLLVSGVDIGANGDKRFHAGNAPLAVNRHMSQVIQMLRIRAGPGEKLNHLPRRWIVSD